MENLKVSIVVPVYNVQSYLKCCINSIINQTYHNLEIILVDDGSTDDSSKICDEYAALDSRIIVIHKQNAGQSAARNDALDIMTGDFCFFLDSDDYIHIGCIEYLMLLQQKYDADLIQCSYEKGCDNTFSSKQSFQESSVSIFDNRNIFESSLNNVILCGKLYSSKLWNSIRMPVGVLNEDDATAWKLYYTANKTVVTPDKLYYYRINPKGTMANFKKVPNIIFPMNAYHERIEFFDKIGDKHLSDLSKWRYSKYLMTTFHTKNLLPDQYQKLKVEFTLIYRDVLQCKTVPFMHKMLIIICSISPKFGGFLVDTIRR